MNTLHLKSLFGKYFDNLRKDYILFFVQIVWIGYELRDLINVHIF